jgi:tripartite-type tricarboxylate transporter receptor subunit TctC
MKYIVFLFLSLASVFASAESWTPATKSIEIVVPFPAGGGVDKIARVIDVIFQEHGWKSRVVNIPGGQGVIAGNLVAKSKPNGYTLFMGGTGIFDSNIVYRTPGIEYNEKSFAPVISLGNRSLVLAVRSNTPINNYEKFKFYVKANPDKFNIGFWNANTANLFTEWARVEGLPPPNIILYKGGAQQVTDFLGGHVDFVWDTWSVLAPHVQAGKVIPIATLDNQGPDIIRQVAPNSPVVSVAKKHPSLEINIWYGLFAPAGTPDNIIKEINQVVNRGLKKPANQQLMADMLIKQYGGTEQALEKVQMHNFNTYRKLPNEK